uniref:Nephrocystin 3-like N-terminal domain-containing protein n=1 Tax=Bionectria ochroleuca TaxID=29856 RepID=A0A0B7KLK3_BIOOC
MPNSFHTADEDEIVNHEETALSPEVLVQIRSWLQPTDYLAESGEFPRHLSSQAPGTGLWLCQTEKYRKWHDLPDHGSLWIKNIPGAGKSVMAASIIQHLRTTEECPVLFFFFRNIVAANFPPRALLWDWLAQLLPHSPKLQYALQARLGSELSETSDNDLIQLFVDGVSCVPNLYCVGDALDEMTMENKSFLDRLNSLATHRPRTLKLLITSRPKQYLQSALRDSSVVHVSLQQNLVDIDIVSFLNHRFDSASKLETYQIRKQQIIDMVAKRSEGLFLCAMLTMDQVEAALDSDGSVDLQSLEESLPVGLEKTYNNTLATQREEHGVNIDVQILVLEAVTHVSRPLRLKELAHLLKCIYPDATDSAGFRSLVAASCEPSIEILEDETLQSTALGNSLRDCPIIQSDTTHKHMALYCLRYLQSGSPLVEGETSDSASVTFQVPTHKVNPDEGNERYSRKGMKKEVDHFKYRNARLQQPFLNYSVEN